MRTADAGIVAASVVVGIAAVLGGAFDPGPRLVVGSLLALVLATAAASWEGRLTQEEWALLGLIAWGAIAAVCVGGVPLAAREVLTTWLVAWALWVTARRASETTATRALTILVGVGLILALGVACEAMGLGSVRVGGLLENPNLTASLLVIILPALLVANGKAVTRHRILVGIFPVAGIVLTGSRAGLIALLVAGAVALPRGRRRNLTLVVGAVGSVVVLVWRFVSHPDVLAWYRPAIWTAILKLWAAHPVMGVGPGGLTAAAGPVRLLHADHIGKHQFLISYTECSPLAVLVQTGAVGLVIAILAAALWTRRARRDGLLASNAVKAALVAMIVMGLFHDVLSADIVLWWWALVFGLLEGATAGEERPEQRVARRGAKLAAAIATAFVVLWGVVAPAGARWLWKAGEHDLEVLERAVRAEPWYDVPLAWRTRELLTVDSWTWEVAAEALARSRRAARIHSGAASRWGDVALVNARVVTDLGAWPDAVEAARSAFARACELEPHLPWHWLEWARLERTLGDSETASALVRRALAEEPNTVRAWLFLARLDLDSGRILDAREALEQARAATSLRRSPGLNAYERELLAAPQWQFHELEEALE